MLRNSNRSTNTFTVLLAAATLAWLQLPASANPTECRQGGLTRSVEIVYANPGSSVPCEVMYAKPAAGTIEMLWQAMNEAGYCEARAEEFIAKLESMGWQCNTVPAAQADEGLPDS